MENIAAVVEYDYVAKEPDELNLQRGDIIQHIKKMPDGWWEGTLKATNQRGMFPDNFVRVLETADEVELRPKSLAMNRRCRVIYSYTQVNDDELTLSVGDVIEFLGEVEEGWWRGRLRNKVGVFPSNFVKQIEPSPVFASKRPPSLLESNDVTVVKSTVPDLLTNNSGSAIAAIKISATSAGAGAGAVAAGAGAAVQTTAAAIQVMAPTSTTTTTTTLATMASAPPEEADIAPSLPPKPVREYCYVEYAYAPQNDDELELKVGDTIAIISTDLPDKGWWRGELRGKVGVFPDNFVKMFAPFDVAPLNEPQQAQRASKSTAAAANNSNSSSNVANATATVVVSAANTTTHLTGVGGGSFNATSMANSSSSSSNNSGNNQTSNNAVATTSKVFIKKSGSSSSTHSGSRKDSFGSRDSLDDILTETGLPTGNVAAQRKSLENKNLDLTNAAGGDPSTRLAYKRQQQQQQQVATATATSTAELRKSQESLDEKAKSPPPPVLTKKPNLPTKKSTTVTSVAGNILSGFKQKVKHVENKLTTAVSHDHADGIVGSKLSPNNLPEEAPAGSVVMRRAATIAGEDTEFDRVERASMLTDMRAGRVKAPKRRPPSVAFNVSGEGNSNSNSNNNSSNNISGSGGSGGNMVVYLNGSGAMGSGSEQSEDSAKPQSSDDNSTGEEQLLAKPKPREWEKKKAPWMEELKASQVKKNTSPGAEARSASAAPSGVSVAERTSKLFAETNETNVASSTAAAGAAGAAATAATTTTARMLSGNIMQQSLKLESSQKKEQPTGSGSRSGAAELMSKSMVARRSRGDEERLARPKSLALSSRSISPLAKETTTATATTTNKINSGNSSTTTATATATATAITTSASSTLLNAATNIQVNNHQQANTNTNTNSRNSSVIEDRGAAKMVDLERRIEILEGLVRSQQHTIDELRRLQREETDRVKVLRGELDKYAQCVTQV